MKRKNQNNLGDAIQDFLDIIKALRDPIKGCPWDIQQTSSSLIQYVIEEAYEVGDAIRNGNRENVQDELGDLLLQIGLQSEIASESGDFTFVDIVQGITKKLIRRHPHVFKNEKVKTIEEVSLIWDSIKDIEAPLSKTESPISDRLKEKVRSLPAILSAKKISETVSKKGFEWRNIDEVWKKFDEEIQEFKYAIEHKNTHEAEKELGDILFTLINLARWYKLNPEEGLHQSNRCFLDRFSYLEKNTNQDIERIRRDNILKIWEQSKVEYP